MKRFAFTLALALSLGFSSFAADAVDVAPAALQSFKTSFKTASEVEWSATDDYFKANFSLNGQYVSAYYSADGTMIALMRNISSLQLPISLQANLKKTYDQYWISDLVEVTNNEGTAYYVTLENADTKMILKSNSNSDWTSFKKQKKA